MTVKTEDKSICPECKKEESTWWINRNGCCVWCKIKQDKTKSINYDKKLTIANGRGSSQHGIICPYCGNIITINLSEWESGCVSCTECEEDYNIEVEYTATYTTSKIN